MAKQTFTTGQVLTAAQMTSLQQTAMLGGAASAKTASYTLVAADAGTAITMSSASATTITVNTALFSAGDTVHITNLGVGVCTITAGTATVNTSASLALAQYESGFLDFTSTSAAIFVKGAGAAAASGGMTLISEQTASAVTSVTFGSIAGTYKQLLLVWQGLVLSDQATTFRIRLNNNSGTVYREGGPYQNGGAGMVGSTFSTSSVGGGAVPLVQNVTTETIEKYAKGFLLVDNYASTSKYKVYSYQNNFRKGDNGVDMLVNFQGSFESTTAITSVDIVRTTGTGTLTTDTNTSIRLYGIS